MSKAKRKQTISINKLDNISQRLGKLSKKPKSQLNLRESINYLSSKLKRALGQGYDYDDLVAILAEQDIKISASTLKQYLADSPKKSSRKRQKTSSIVARNLSKASDTYPQLTQSKKSKSSNNKNNTNQSLAAINQNNALDDNTSQNTNTQKSGLSILSGIDHDLSSEFNQY